MAQIRLSDDLIYQLIQEKKPLPANLVSGRAMTVRNGHYRKEYSIRADSGSEFVIKIRQSAINLMNFSVILGYKIPGLHTVFRLRRYNGRHFHTNLIEGNRFQDFHVHTATERYQKKGVDEEYFAEASAHHYDLQSAIERLVTDCGFYTSYPDLPMFPSNS